MNRFRFRLENVLRLRSAREEEKKRAFGTAAGRLAEEERRLDDIAESIDDLDRYRTEKGTGRVSARQMIQNFFFSGHLHDQKEKQQKTIEEAHEVVEEKRADMTEAVKERKILDRLKERQRAQYDHEVRREEQALIDELTTQRFKAGDS